MSRACTKAGEVAGAYAAPLPRQAASTTTRLPDRTA